METMESYALLSDPFLHWSEQRKSDRNPLSSKTADAQLLHNTTGHKLENVSLDPLQRCTPLEQVFLAISVPE